MEINLNLFSQRSMKLFQSALRFVTRMKHGFIGSEHLLWALSREREKRARRSGETDWTKRSSKNTCISMIWMRKPTETSCRPDIRRGGAGAPHCGAESESPRA